MEDAVNHTKLEKLLLGAARVFNSTLEYEKLMELVRSISIDQEPSWRLLAQRRVHQCYNQCRAVDKEEHPLRLRAKIGQQVDEDPNDRQRHRDG